MADGRSGGEYTLLRMQIQRGDGPDRRGKVEVEIQRERDPHAGERGVDTDDDGIAETEVRTQDETFGEFFHETERATRLLEERLGLSDDE